MKIPVTQVTDLEVTESQFHPGKQIVRIHFRDGKTINIVADSINGDMPETELPDAETLEAIGVFI